MRRARLRLAVLASIALGCGAALYFLCREPTLLTSALVAHSSSRPGLPFLANLPSALHVFAFSLLGVALSSRLGVAKPVALVLALGMILELAQLPAGPWQLSSGTFDLLDLLACLLGALAAAATAGWMLPERTATGWGSGSGGRVVIALLAVASSVATSPPPPDTVVRSNLDQLCPGSAVTLTWEWMSGSQPPEELFLVASHPKAISPSFDRLSVEADGWKEVVILDDVVFHIESFRGMSYPILITVIPSEGVERTLWNSSICSGSVLTWDPVTVSYADNDARADVESVSVPGGASLDVRIGKEGSESVLSPGEVTSDLAGLPFAGSWRIEPAETPTAPTCPIIDPGDRVQVAVEVKVVCPPLGTP